MSEIEARVKAIIVEKFGVAESEVTSDSETPNFSTIIAFTLASISDIVVIFKRLKLSATKI